MAPVEILAGTVALALILSGCASSKNETVVLAAASLAPVLPELQLLAEPPRVEVETVIAGSPSLVTQLENGIPADVILTANLATMDRAVASGRTTGEPVKFAANELVLAVAPDNPAQITTITDIAKPAVVLGWCAPAVPCGVLAGKVLAALDLQIDAATEESNVSALATKVTLGELDAAFIYATDAQARHLEVVEIGLASEVATGYYAVAIDNSANGQRVVDTLGTAAARAILYAAGFSAP